MTFQLLRACAKSAKPLLLAGTLSPLLTIAASDLPCTPAACAYANPALAPEVRARDLVARMTLAEKVAQMGDRAPAIERLGLKRYGWWNEVLHGLARAGHATVFPQAIGLAATWDTGLMNRIGDAISTEGRASFNAALRRDPSGTDRYFGVNYWSPNINIYRDPRWGRGQETYGEDPILAGKLAVAFIRGIQGDDPHVFKGIATPKHFAVHSGPEPLRHGFKVDPSPFDLEDTYLPAFRSAIVDGQADSLMCAYNAINGLPACASPLLQSRLRDDWGFKGFVVTDCDAVDDMVTGHKDYPDAAHASAAAVKAGTDLDCGTSYDALTDAVAKGLIREDDIDRSLIRLMTARIRMGLLDGSKFDAIQASEINAAPHGDLALRAAGEAIVLLKNKGRRLPLGDRTRIAVIGPNAALLQSIEGNYTGVSLEPSLPLDALREAFGAANIRYAAGAPLIDGMRMPVPETYLKPSMQAEERGLKGEYFDNLHFAGTPKMTRTDPLVNFNFFHTAPPGFAPMGFSVRWTGVLTPPAAGTYEIGFRMMRRRGEPVPDVKVWIDGELVVTPALAGITADTNAKCIAGNCSLSIQPIHIKFADTRPHQVRIDYVRATEDRASAFDWVPPKDALQDAAVGAARDSDVVVAFVGLSPDLEGEEMPVNYPGFKGGDRTSLLLPDAQRRLLEAVKKTGKPLVVVYLTGGSISDPWVEKNADAIVQAWYPGQAAGRAIAGVLTGKINPAGRLPYTIHRSITDLPPFEDYAMDHRTYRYFKGPVLYPFGHGLSYSRFSYSKPVLSRTKVKAGDDMSVTVTVRNDSPRDGDEVVQVYLAKPGARANPVLAGFRRIHLHAGASEAVKIDLDARMQSQVDSTGARKVVPGVYAIHVGGGQPNYGATVAARMTVEGAATLGK